MNNTQSDHNCSLPSKIMGRSSGSTKFFYHAYLNAENATFRLIFGQVIGARSKGSGFKGFPGIAPGGFTESIMVISIVEKVQ